MTMHIDLAALAVMPAEAIAERRSDRFTRSVIDGIRENGVGSCEDAEWLLEVDIIRRERDDVWRDFVSSAVIEFVVWQCRPTGRVDQPTAEWLLRALSNAQPDSKRAILFGVIREAESAPPVLAETLMRDGMARAMLV
jgi:hypothetical protein